MSRPTLVIGTKNLSSWSLRPWLLCKQLHIEFDELELPLDTPEYYERIENYSPTKRVPVWIAGDLKVWDSLAICEHVNELTLGAGWPSDRNARAHARSISAEMHSGFAALRTQWTMRASETGLRVPLDADGQNDVRRVGEIWNECREKYGATGPWLFGAFSIADAMYAPVALRFHSYGANIDAGSSAYTHTVLNDTFVREWIEAARRAK